MLSNSIVEEIFIKLSENIQNPEIELYYTNEFTLLVAVVLSARNTDKGVNKVTKDLFEIIKTPRSCINFGIENFQTAIKTIGLYKTKATNIFKTAQILIDQYDEKIPNNFEELIKLPGVGRKSANVILNTLFGHPVIAVDTHVFRVSRRLGLSDQNTVEKVERDLNLCVPEKFKNTAHHLLVLHGRYVCKALKPKCITCILQNLCPSFEKFTSSVNKIANSI